MKKSNPKLILNLSLEDEELEKKIEIAMEQYVDKIVSKNLDAIIEKYITKRIDEIVDSNNRYSYHRIGGKTLDDYVKERVNSAITNSIDNNIQEILSKKIAKLLSQ